MMGNRELLQGIYIGVLIMYLASILKDILKEKYK